MCRWQSVVQCQFVAQFVVVFVVLLWVREGVADMLSVAPSLPGMLLLLGPLPRKQFANLEEEDVDASATAVVAMVAETCLVEAVEEGYLEPAEAKASAAQCC